MSAIKQQENAQDRRYGFPFGVDGVLNLDQARALMGSISRATLDRHAESGSIRKARVNGRVMFCRRSIAEYLRSCEI